MKQILLLASFCFITMFDIQVQKGTQIQQKMGNRTLGGGSYSQTNTKDATKVIVDKRILNSTHEV
ncbi:MAG: hypothetical protein PHG27_07345 [Massilibacteroides sp.]|nr:hypothetical protein [Massilibacteroides sp.]MDD3061551.1 hypothetical protein [Massilibacteroides sp.]MDD4115394.1 hypothetical protein [Massilibacteroides sp.]MDD4659159.1 hypothetical protein [Massilibacteroides sp.]